MREFIIGKGETKCLLKRQSSSIPETIEFEATPLHANETVAGQVEIRSAAIIVPLAPRHQPLVAMNAVQKKGTDTWFSIWVTPEVDVRVQMLGSANMKFFWILIAIAMVVILLGGVLIILTGG